MPQTLRALAIFGVYVVGGGAELWLFSSADEGGSSMDGAAGPRPGYRAEHLRDVVLVGPAGRGAASAEGTRAVPAVRVRPAGNAAEVSRVRDGQGMKRRLLNLLTLLSLLVCVAAAAGDPRHAAGEG